MINHIRTLLLNIAASADPQWNLSEYISPDYRPIQNIPGDILRVLQIIYGGNPDVYGKLYRVRELMALLHAPDRESFIIAKDQRITYLPLRSFLDIPWGFSGSPNVVGVATTEDPIIYSGRLNTVWSIQNSDTDTVSISSAGVTTTENLTTSSSVSNLVPLPGTSARFRVRMPLTAGGGFQIVRWEKALPPIESLPARLRSMDLSTLFTGYAEAPQFYAMFESDTLDMCLSGVSLALAYKLDTLRG
jgi:hypothetical protein